MLICRVASSSKASRFTARLGREAVAREVGLIAIPSGLLDWFQNGHSLDV
jgi:hypothetical protein